MKQIILLASFFIAFFSSAQDVPFGPDSTLWKIENLIEAERLDSAISLSDQTINKPHLKNEAAAWYLRGVAFLLAELSEDLQGPKKVNLMEVSRESFGKALTLDPSADLKASIDGQVDAANYYLLMEGANMFSKKAYGAAQQTFEQGIRWKLMIRETDTLGHYNAALAAERAGDTASALNHYQKCIDYNYEALNATFYKINLLNASRNQREAEKFIKLASEKFPEFEGRFALEPYLGKYREAMESGNKKEGLDVLELAKAAYPENFRVYMYTAKHYLKENDSIPAALAVIDEGVEKAEEKAELYYLRGTVLESTGRNKEALKAFEDATEIRPEFGDAWYNMGAIWYSKGHEMSMLGDKWKHRRKAKRYFKKAKPFLEKAYKIQPEDEDTYKALKNVYYQLDDKAGIKRMGWNINF